MATTDYESLEEVLTFAKLTDPEKVAFKATIGATGEENPEIIGMISEADFAEAIRPIMIEENPPTLIQKGKFLLVARTCRGIVDRRSNPAPAAGASGVEPDRMVEVLNTVTKLTAALAPKAGPTVNLKTVVSQGLEDTVPKLSRETLTKYFDDFKKVFGREPGANEECSAEQLTGLKSMLDGDVAPYVDFGVWGPHHHRLLRKLRLSGLQLHTDGTLKMVELVGPPDFDTWLRSYQLLLTGLVGFGAVSLGPLLDYAEKIRSYTQRYGESTWALLYQADVRCRQEHMERVRRELERGAAKANAEGRLAAHPFDPAKPWDSVWSASVKDGEFWRREFEEPALLVLTHVGRMQDMVSGEAPVAQTVASSSAGSPSMAPTGNVQPPRQPPPAKRKKTNTFDEQAPKHHKVGQDGLFTHNRSGKPLCLDFQSGACTRGNGNRCPKSSAHVHQCNRCLDIRHGGHMCQATPQAPGGSGNRKGGKGKGKGKKH